MWGCTCAALLSVALSATEAQAAVPQPAIIPQPEIVHVGRGSFKIDAATRVILGVDRPELTAIGKMLAELLGLPAPKFHPQSKALFDPRSAGTILLTLADESQAPAKGPEDPRRRLWEESYTLDVSAQQVVIRGGGPAGVFYGVQTLRQLLPAEIEAGCPAQLPLELPQVKIEDRPRFLWRGMHLDIARHFFHKEFLKRYIDFLAAYKINVFHLYLTDDQGWRIEIKRYPKLTEVGAWRDGTVRHRLDGQRDTQRYGGFLSQDDVRQLVHYAAQRHVMVVPGISMPGHSQAALAAYPELAAPPTKQPIQVWTDWGISSYMMDVGKEEVYRFIEGVLSEVVELFPSPYIHTGGDEVPRQHWMQSPFCQQLMKRENLRSVEELQGYFTKRVEQFLNSKGRTLIGWDEIVECGLPPRAVVMSWRGTQGGMAAARAGHQVIMTPNAETYFNYMQHRERSGPGHAAFLPLLKVYRFDPCAGMSPEEARHVLGGQGCLWTEYVPTAADVEYLLFPRLLAMAEVLWSPRQSRNEEDFLRRVREHVTRLKQAGVNCYQGEEYK